MYTQFDRLYDAAIYLRLSQEDGDLSNSDKNESNSISTQRELIHSYLRKHPEITFVAEFCDDGYTGTNFERPGFESMMKAVHEKRVNCIIVKDLSRFGRDYIESGKYIQKVFPMMGIRFIAINDCYDSANNDNQVNDFVLPFKNLINDSYCRDISIKSRTNLEVMRRNGEFVNNYTAYGYMRSPQDRHKLIVDEEAAAIVRSIFAWKLEGYNALQIANRLNESGVLSPMEYKRKHGQRFYTSFKTNAVAQWSAVAVLRILKNVVYTGVLEQGKTTTPNYKVKIRRQKDESEWAVVQNAHEAIISPSQFELVQEVLAMDTCRGAGNEMIYPFSGLLYCADCKSPMYHRLATVEGKKYHYYLCSQNRRDKESCSSHNIKQELVENAVLATVKAHIATALDIADAMQRIDALDWDQREIRRIDGQIAALEAEAERYASLKMGMYEDLKSGLITKEEYQAFKADYDARIADAKKRAGKLAVQRSDVEAGLTERQGWFAQFQQYANIEKLDRITIVSLIQRIEIGANKEIYVTFRYADQFAEALAYLNPQNAGKEAVCNGTGNA